MRLMGREIHFSGCQLLPHNLPNNPTGFTELLSRLVLADCGFRHNAVNTPFCLNDSYHNDQCPESSSVNFHECRAKQGTLLASGKENTAMNCRTGGPTEWNSLPYDVRHSVSTSSFKQALKTHLFKSAYN